MFLTLLYPFGHFLANLLEWRNNFIKGKKYITFNKKTKKLKIKNTDHIIDKSFDHR